MKPTKKTHLLLEQLEERIFLDANPVAAVVDEPVDPAEQAEPVMPPQEASQEAQPEEKAAEESDAGESSEQTVEASESTSAEADEGENSADVASGDETTLEAGEAQQSADDSSVEAEAEEKSLAAETEQEDQNSDTAATEPEPEAEPVTQVVFVDSSVNDHQTLLDGILADIDQNAEDESATNVQIIELDNASDQVQQIADALAQHSDLSGVHIISHGSENSLRLGNTTITTETIDEYTDQLTTWGESLSADGDILLYGCNIAEESSEASFIDALAEVTGADIAASDDATGNAASGGDWELEASTGLIETKTLKDASGEWEGLLAPPDPDSVAEASNENPMINSSFTFSVAFDNSVANASGTETGYGPFVDVVVPAEIDITGDPVIYGSTANFQLFTWNGSAWEDADGNVVDEHPGLHPTSPAGSSLEMPTGTANGDKWYYIEYPFGSYTVDQPTTDVVFTAEANTASGAEVGVGYDITHRAGFSYGDTATNNNGPIQDATPSTLTITPQVIDIEKDHNAPEDQTATGPNFPVEYTLTVNVAAGETVDNVVVKDYLPENAVFRGDVEVTALNGASAVTPTITEPATWTVLGSDANDRLLTIDLGSITGVADPNQETAEYQITYTVYFSEVDANGDTLLPGIGGDRMVENESEVSGQYNGVTVSDGVNNNDNETPSDREIEIASIVTRKDVEVVGGGNPFPGTTLEYTVQIDVSDYYTADGIVLNDILGDGQTFDASFTPTISVWENGSNIYNGNFDSGNYVLGDQYGADDVGGTTLDFDISQQLVSAGLGSALDGGLVDGVTDAAMQDGDTLNGRIGPDGTTIIITFQTTVDNDYDEFQGTGGDNSVDMYDSITNHVTVNAEINDQTIASEAQTDISATSVTIEGNEVSKEIFAINGDTNFNIDNGVTSGDLVTYHLQLTLPTARFENLIISDYLPLPVYDSGEIGLNTGNDFNGTINFTAGEVEFGPEHNLHRGHIPGLEHEGTPLVGNDPLAPTFTIDDANNAVIFDFGGYDVNNTDPAEEVTIDLLITVTIQNEAMVDGLLLTNQAGWAFDNTSQETNLNETIVQITLREPEVQVVKGVVATTNPSGGNFDQVVGPADITFNPDGTISVNGSVDAEEMSDTPIDANLSDAEAGDTVTFAVAVYNTGSANAFDIHLTDDLPNGFVDPGNGLDLRVYSGDGTLLNEGTDYTVGAGGFFAGGITFENTALSGNNDPNNPPAGSDVFIVTYQLEVDSNENVVVGGEYTNTASVDFYTGQDDSDTDWTDRLGEPTDDASIEIVNMDPLVKHLDGSEIDNATNGEYQAVVGETATYTVTMYLPEATLQDAQFVDTLDAGLRYVDGSFTVVGFSSELQRTNGDPLVLGGTPTISGQQLTFDLGTIVNTATDGDDTQADYEYITFTYDVYVDNVAGNQAGTHLDNSAQVTYNTATDGGTETVSTTPVTATDPATGADVDLEVIEPELDITKTLSGSPVDAGDDVEYTIVISNTSATDAFDINFEDQIPGAVENPTVTVASWTGSGPAPTFTLSGNTLTCDQNDSFDILQGETLTIVVSGTLAQGVTPGQMITNQASVTWQSLNDGHTNNNTDLDRDGEDGPGGLNDYADTDAAVINITEVTVNKELVATGDAANGVDAATIGETATYTVEVTVPEGTLLDAQLEDVLDPGLEFVSLDSVSWPASGLTSTADQDNNGLSGGEVTHIIDGQKVIFSLGTLTNQGTTNSGTQTFTLQYTVRVVDDQVNQAGEAPNNEACLTWGPAGDRDCSDPDSANVNIIEPQITSDKTISTDGVSYTESVSDVEAGDTLYYEVTFTNTSSDNATAYEVTGTDTLPNNVELVAGSATVTNSSGVVNGVDIIVSTSGNQLTFTNAEGGWDIEKDGFITIRYQVVVQDDFVVDGTATNTIDADWSSQDGDDPNERTYDDQGTYTVDGDQDTDTASFTTPGLTIDKADGTDQATIGDTITYTLSLDAPEGVVQDMSISDTLSAGLIFAGNAQISTDGGATYTDLAPTTVGATNDGTVPVTVTWNMGDYTVDTDNQILIRYDATVANVDATQAGSTLSNSVTLSYTNKDGDTVSQTDTDDFTVVEPQITSDKTISTDGVSYTESVSDVEAGDTLYYEVTFTNTSSAATTAYEVVGIDTLPDNVELVAGSVAVVGSSGVTNGTDVSVSTSGNQLTFTNAAGGWDIEKDGFITIRYQVVVQNDFVVDGTATNTIDADWSSQDGDDPNERTYDDQGTYTVDGDQDTDTASFTTPGLTIDKADGTDQATIGDTITYTLSLDAPEGVVQDMSISDTLSAGLIFAGNAQISTDGGATYTDLAPTTVGATNDGTVPVTVTWNMGDYTVDTDNQILIRYDATVANVDATQAGSTLSNSVTLSYTNKDGDTVSQTDTDDFTVVEPQITTSKSVVDLGGDGPGDTQADELYDVMQYTVTLENTGGATAYEVTAQDIASPGMQNVTLVGVTHSNGTDLLGTSEMNSGTLDNEWLFSGDASTPWELAAGESITIVYTAQVAAAWFDPVSTTPNHPNTVDADWSSQEGTGDPNDRVYNDATDGAGNPIYDVDGTQDTATASYTITPGTGSIGDTVWFDANDNGFQEGSEVGLAGVEVLLEVDFDGDGSVDYQTTTTTDANGNYLFDELQAASYTITVNPATLPAGTTPSYDLDGITNNPDGSAVYTLTAGEHTDRVDFGYTGAGSIGDTIWSDLNGDGVQDAGESGLAGVAVTITGDLDGDGDASDTLTVTTDTDGNYLFDHLLAGDYTITVDPNTLPAGVVQTADPDGGNDNTASLTLGAGEDNLDQDFGYLQTTAIGDTVWFDSNANGILDGGELGLSGVTVTLNGPGGVTETTTTDADGRYLFTGLAAGDYTITLTNLPDGVEATADPDGGADNTSSLTLSGGEVNLDQDFGYTGAGSIGDTIWSDLNGDGVQDAGESGLAGVAVTITGDLDGDGDASDTLTVTTDTDGNYLFDHLLAGDYTITVDPSGLPAGVVQTADPDGGNDNTASLTLGAGEDNLDQDFGYQQSGTIGDTVWFDSNANGILDGGELGLSGVTVTLTGPGGVTETTTTDADGRYLFTGLGAGDYTITLTNLPDGVEATADPDGGADNTSSLTLTGGGVDLDQDFGYTGTGSIGDTIWSDLNGDGVQDAGETGLAGVAVTITGDLDGDGDASDTLTVTTDTDGNYLFDHLLAGDYTITVDPSGLPAGVVQTADPDGGNDNTASLTLGAGEDNLDQDFGYRQSGTIGDTVWFDSNANSILDGGELGLSGVTVTLNGPGGVTETATTDADGRYLFTGLGAGDYTITLTNLPDGVEATADPDGGADNTSSLTLTAGEENLDQDFGYTGAGSIGDTIWNDLNGDGIQDAGESGLAGVAVTITGDLDGDGDASDTLTVTTDPNGNYIFDNLLPGDYTITVDPTNLPPGMEVTGDPDGANDGTTTLTLGAGEDNLDQDFGYQQSGTIGDTVWFDSNANGILDGGELGLSGVTVTLNGPGGVTETTTTDADGRYLFTGLGAGDYTITLTNLPDGVEATADPDGGADNTSSLTLSGGGVDLDQDFGYTGTGSIGDTIWNDLNGDGVQNPGESGIDGVTVTLTADVNGDGVPDVFTTQTGPDGSYLFDNLPAGTFEITVDPNDLPAGMVQTADPDGTNDNTTTVSLTAGEDNLDQDFGYRQSGAIGDIVWFDIDGDGVQDSGELGISGVTVTLNGPGGVTETATTNADGWYLFTGLDAGDYTITLTNLPDGVEATADPDGGADNTSSLTLGTDEVNLNQDFGYTGAGSVGDTIWNDLNGDGVQDPGESGLAGVAVTITGDLDGDGDASDTLTVTTDPNGNYIFDNLLPGDYTITVDPTNLPPGMEVTGDPDGANDGTTTVSLTAGEDNLDQDFGYHLVGGQLGDTVWFDSNGNGIQDPDEPGLANVRVILTGNLDADPELEHLITLTDANGNYQFDDLPAGHYTVEIDPSTLPNGVEATHDLDGTSTVNVAELDLGINGVNQDVDFGYTGTGSIGDTIWYDADNDGIQDPGESGIPGVTLTLIGDVNGDGTPETYTTQTDANGNYIFDNLPEGNFVINVDTSTLPGGMVITADPDGVTDSTTTVNLAAGEVNTDQDFAYTGTGSIGDTIWNDLDGDGVQDPGEPGLSGVQITIGVDLDGDGVPDHTTTTTTNASGGYIFDNLPEGSHVVSVNPATLPEDMAPTADLDGDGTADNSIVVTLSSGTMDTDVIDFGYIRVEHPDGGPHDGPHGVYFPPMLPPEPVTEGPVVDAFFLYQQFGEGMTELPWERLQDIEYSLPPLSVGTVYTGIAEPGTTLFLTLYDNDGNQVGYQTVMADAAGNWLASFPATLMYDVPHHMNIEQTASNYNEDGTLGLFNLRTYFNPNFTSMVYSNSTLDVDAVLAFLPSTIMASMHESNLKGFELGWNDFEGYEFSAPSVNPAKNIH